MSRRKKERYIMCHEERERLKAEADYHTLEGAWDVIFAHYERSREAWYSVKGRYKEHPSYEEYAAAYVANPHCDSLFGEKVARRLRKQYPGGSDPHMPNGSSYWFYSLKEAKKTEEYWRKYKMV